MYKRVFIFLSLLTAITGILAIGGWLFDAELLFDYRRMEFCTALGLFLAGSATFVLHLKPSRQTVALFRTFSVMLFATGVLCTLGLLFEFDSPIDELMAGNLASVCFTLLGMAFLTLRTTKKLLLQVSQGLLYVVMLISGVSLMSILYRMPSIQKFANINPMDLQSSIALIILSSAASFINHKLGLTSFLKNQREGNMAGKRILKRMIILTVILGVLRYVLISYGIIAQEFEMISMTLCFAAVSLFAITEAVLCINQLDSRRSQAEEELGIVNYSLGKIILERTRELNQAIDDLRQSEARLKSLMKKYPES